MPYRWLLCGYSKKKKKKNRETKKQGHAKTLKSSSNDQVVEFPETNILLPKIKRNQDERIRKQQDSDYSEQRQTIILETGEGIRNNNSKRINEELDDEQSTSTDPGEKSNEESDNAAEPVKDESSESQDKNIHTEQPNEAFYYQYVDNRSYNIDKKSIKYKDQRKIWNIKDSTFHQAHFNGENEFEQSTSPTSSSTDTENQTEGSEVGDEKARKTFKKKTSNLSSYQPCSSRDNESKVSSEIEEDEKAFHDTNNFKPSKTVSVLLKSSTFAVNNQTTNSSATSLEYIDATSDNTDTEDKEFSFSAEEHNGNSDVSTKISEKHAKHRRRFTKPINHHPLLSNQNIDDEVFFSTTSQNHKNFCQKTKRKIQSTSELKLPRKKAGKKSKDHENDKSYEAIEMCCLRKNRNAINPCARGSDLDVSCTSSSEFIHLRHNTDV